MIVGRKTLVGQQARFRAGHAGKKSPAAHHHQLVSRSRDGDIEPVGVVQEWALEVIGVRGGQRK